MKWCAIRPKLGAIALGCLIMACVDPILVDHGNRQPKIVIDAYFTTSTQFNTVRISRSADFSNHYPFVPFNEPVSSAVVKVYSSDRGRVFDFVETSPGTYATTETGEVGESYFAEVVLADGSSFISETAVIPEPVSIDSLTFDLKQEITIVESSGSHLELKHFFFNVNASLYDPPDTRNYYLWRAHGVFEYITLPPGDAPCEYCYCYAPLYPLLPYVNVLSDQLVDGGRIVRKVASIKYDRKTAFLTKLSQFSITEEAYRFWNAVYEQQTKVGSTFDPTPAKIRGNFRSSADPGEEVPGFFTTAAVTSKNLLLKRGLEAQRQNIDEPNLLPMETGDCRPKYAGATHIKPIEFYD